MWFCRLVSWVCMFLVFMLELVNSYFLILVVMVFLIVLCCFGVILVRFFLFSFIFLRMCLCMWVMGFFLI